MGRVARLALLLTVTSPWSGGAANLTLETVEREPAIFVVRFDGPVREPWKHEVRAAGATLLDYAGDFSFLARIPANRVQTVRSQPHIASVDEFAAERRITPEISSRLATAAFVDAPTQVRIVLFDDVDPKGWTSSITSLGGQVDGTVWNPWVSFLDATVPASTVATIASWPAVKRIEEVVTFHVLNQESAPTVQTGRYSPETPPFWAAGLRGQGQIVTMMDSGLDVDHGLFAQTSASPGTPGPSHRKVLAYGAYGGDLAACPSADHGTHVAGTVVGNASAIGLDPTGEGMAPDAKIRVQDVMGGAGCLCTGASLCIPSDVTTALTDSLTAGAFLHTNSWGGSSNIYSAHADQFDGFMWTNKSFLALFAAGNAGPGSATVGTPGTAKNVLTVGAHNADPAQDVMASFSSRGPAVTAGSNRRKPTVTAPGHDGSGADDNAGSVGIRSAASDGDATVGTAWLSISGTSMATPATAGVAALVRQYFVDGWYPTGAPVGANSRIPTSALIRAVLINSARNMTRSTARPSNSQGWGRITLDDALHLCGEDRSLWIVEDRVATGELDEFLVAVDGSLPLNIALAWTDRKGDLLVNDLDLTVSLGATTWLGSVFSGGSSTTGGAADRTNPDEMVMLASPAPGTYAVRVTGFNVPQGEGAVGGDPPGDSRQPYALVISGRIASVNGVPINRAPDRVTKTGPFDGIRSGDATPAWRFQTPDPDANAIDYELQWSSDPAFATSTTRLVTGIASNVPASYMLTVAETLAAGTWYWRVRARDPLGTGCYSAWSPRQSYTVQGGRTTDGWHYGTSAQFEAGTFEDTTVAGGGVQLVLSTTINLSPAGAISASSVFSANYPATHGNDRTSDTVWASDGTVPSYLQVDLGELNRVSRVQVHLDSYAAENTPGDFTVGASTDGITFTTVATVVNGTARFYTFDLSPRPDARYVRLTVTDRIAGPPGGPLVTAELRVYGAPRGGRFIGPAFKRTWATNQGWSEFSWTHDASAGGSVVHRLEYFDGAAWALVPDAVLPGNSLGLSTSPVSLTPLGTTATYATLRPVATFTAGSTPTVQSLAFEVDPPSTTASRIDDLEALETAGGVLVSWTLRDPIGVMEMRVQRGASAWETIGALPVSASLEELVEYSLLDPRGAPADHFRLEVVLEDGTTELYGPVSPGAASDGATGCACRFSNAGGTSVLALLALGIVVLTGRRRLGYDRETMRRPPFRSGGLRDVRLSSCLDRCAGRHPVGP